MKLEHASKSKHPKAHWKTPNRSGSTFPTKKEVSELFRSDRCSIRHSQTDTEIRWITSPSNFRQNIEIPSYPDFRSKILRWGNSTGCCSWSREEWWVVPLRRKVIRWNRIRWSLATRIAERSEERSRFESTAAISDRRFRRTEEWQKLNSDRGRLRYIALKDLAQHLFWN